MSAPIPLDRRPDGRGPAAGARRVLRLAGLLARRGGARHWTVLGLTAAGIVVATLLALLALSVSPGLGARGDRVAWRTPTAVADPATATAVHALTTDHFRGRDISVVELAPTGRGTPPVPPGLRAFPAPGELVVSPALADLLAAEPAAALADRYPGTIVATVGPEGLAIAEDLVVVVGRAEGELTVTDATRTTEAPDASGSSEGGAPISGFATTGTDDDLADYQLLAQMAAVLLVVPTVLLVGALARLTAAQREQRLAALRLVGATPGLVVAVTALETGLAALIGAVGGVAAYLAVLPAAARIELAGAGFAVGDLRLGAAQLALALVVVPMLAVLSATVALRAVVIGPLGVRHRRPGRRPRAVRLAVVPLAWVFLVVAVDALGEGGSTTAVLLGLGAVIGTLAVVGPWLTWLVGWVLARGSRRPAAMIAGRRIVDDARGAYRTIGGMVLAGLIAGVLFGSIPTIRSTSESVDRLEDATDLFVSVPSDRVDAVTASVSASGSGAAVRWEAVDPEPEPATGAEPEAEAAAERWGDVAMPPGTDPEVVRTAVLVAAPGAYVSSVSDLDARATLLVEDLGRASVVMALAALALATVATAIGGTASILDQRVTLARLRLAGTGVGVLQRARRWQALVPLGLASIGAMASGAAAAQLLMVAAGARPDEIQPPEVPPLVALALAALVAGTVAVAATRPVLVAATRSTPRE